MGQGARNNPVAQRVEQALTPLLAGEGFELVLTEYVPRSHVLRLFIDHLDPAAGGVTLDDCTHTTHLISDFLDAEGLSDAIEGRFTLEVSSPGLDRPLVRPQHFVRFVGHEAQVVLLQSPPDLKGRRKLKGELVAADDDAGGGIRLQSEGQQRSIPYAAIERARLVPQL